MTYRLFKVSDDVKGLNSTTVSYAGTYEGSPDSYTLSKAYTFPKGEKVKVEGPTAAAVKGTWLAKHFESHCC